jgi:uncharacterized membrane protein HdeD (DUF308 family)
VAASRGTAQPLPEGVEQMVVLGLILLILGLVLSMSLLVTIGVILLVVGLIVNLVPFGGTRRRVY